jgi:UDP-N-acetylglucosamine--N-acetylmuramyl-(pentapeptide) pyrophosphoryl-undecaprenol N-acetylglucosamine transferase
MSAGHLRIVIAGGGTGGHLFPGIAIAEAFVAADPENQIRFLGTDRAVETNILADTAFAHRVIPADGLKGRGLWRQLAALLKLPLALAHAAWHLKTFCPDLIVAVGGYVSGPVALAGWLFGIPIVCQEQNRIMGITNRWVGKIARRVYLSFAPHHPVGSPAKVRVTGNPVRRRLFYPSALPKPAPFTVLVLGGSQGAQCINRAVEDAIAGLSPTEGIGFLHQTGAFDAQRVTAAYCRHQIPATVAPFFTDMASAYACADLVVTRAGATTIAELTALGKPAIFIPFAMAADNHQVQNASSLAASGAAEMLLEADLNGKTLAERICFFRHHPQQLTAMADKAGAQGCPDAASAIVSDCYALLGLGVPETGPMRSPEARPCI